MKSFISKDNGEERFTDEALKSLYKQIKKKIPFKTRDNNAIIVGVVLKKDGIYFEPRFLEVRSTKWI